MIHITDKQTDNIIGFFTHKNVTFNEHIQNLETYQDTFEFTTFGDHKYAHTLTDMNRVIIPAEDGGYSEYVINTVRKRRDRSNKVRVKSFASYQMLSVAKVIDPTTLSAYTPSQALGFVTNDTEWRPGIVESNATRTFHIENYTDRLSFLKTVANEFDLEIRFRVETDGKRVTGRFIDLLEQVGEWRGREVTFGKDLESIERTSEGKIVTKLICLGPEDENGNRLKVEVSDDDALRRWGRPHPITGELMHLEDKYEPTSDRSEMTEAELRQYGRTELNKRINAIVTYEAEIVDLENVPGMANKKIRFGDTVRIKDEKFNPPLYVEARIFEQRRDIFTKSNKKVKLGDFIEYSEEELRAVIDRLSKQMQTKIGAAQLIEHTYSKIEIDNKDQYVFTEGKSFAEAVGVTAEDNAKQYASDQDSALKIDVEDYADQIANQAEDNAKQHADDVSAQALQQALAESVAQDAYDTKMAQIADDLSDKAGIAYVDGQLVSAIEGIEIGGRNLLEGTSGSFSNVIVSNYSGMIDNKRFIPIEDLGLKEGDQVTARVFINLTEEGYGGRIRVDSDVSTNLGNANEIDESTGSGYSTTTFTIPVGSTNISFYIGNIHRTDGVDRYTVEIKELKLEKGNKATDWTPAPEDIFSEIETKADGSTVYTISEVDNMINNTVSLTQYTTDINGIVSDLSDQSTQIGQNTEAIGLKADQTTVDALSGTVNSHSAQFLTMADEISARVTADYVQTAIDDIEIGGRNYLRDTERERSFRGFALMLNLQDNKHELASSPAIVSFYAKHGEDDQGFNLHVYYRTSGGSNLGFSYGKNQYTTDSYRRFEIPIDDRYIPSDMSDYATLAIRKNSNTGTIYIKNIKLERGTKATDWSPAPEDVEAEISSLSAELSVQAGKINAKADSTTVTALGVRTTSVEQSLDAIEGQIVNKVEVDDVKSIFTQEAGSFTFDASQVNFTGHIFGQGATFNGDISGSTISGSLLRSESYRAGSLSIATIDDASIQVFRNDVNLGYYFRNEITENAIKIESQSGYRVANLTSETLEFTEGSNVRSVETIVSQGSNSNGYWIRYSSGFQICWNPLMSATGSAQASGAIYRSEPQTWNFPQPFSTSPAVSGSVRATGRWLSSGATSNTSATLIQYSSASGTLYSMDMIAIGRWK